MVSLRYEGFDALKDGYAEVASSSGEKLVVSVPIEKREIAVCAWVKFFGPKTAAILLDTDIEGNSPKTGIFARRFMIRVFI